jgi:hypothetical protein
MFMDGYFPENEVDHINGDRLDNRWSNLRHVSTSCNQQNRKISSKTRSGFTGVGRCERNGLWRVRATINGRETHIGFFEDPISAALARCNFEVCCPDWSCNRRAENFVKLRKLGYKI